MSGLSHLDELEAEAIYIIREVAAECEKPVMLYSIGKDSSVMLHLAVENDGDKPYFQKDDIKVGGYVFEEFYFNLENAMMSKTGSDKKTYHVGDEVPVSGDSFKYPEYFDVLSVEDGAAVLIRDGKVEDIQRIEDYRYIGLPVVDERGMALLVKNKAELGKFFEEAKTVTVENRSELHNKWFRFETYRKVVCTDNFWVI